MICAVMLFSDAARDHRRHNRRQSTGPAAAPHQVIINHVAGRC